MERLCELTDVALLERISDMASQGIFWAFAIFNFLAVFAFSWVYLHGARDFRRWLSKRKTRKEKSGAGAA